MKAFMNRETVEVNIKEQLAQLISKYNASQQSLADNVRALNQKYKEDVQAKTYTPEHLREVYEENKAALLAVAAEKAKVLNASARGAVEHLSGKAVPALSTSEKPADYAVHPAGGRGYQRRDRRADSPGLHRRYGNHAAVPFRAGKADRAQ